MGYVDTYALIYLHTILGEGMDSRDDLPRGALPSGILKMRKKCPGLKVRFPDFENRAFFELHIIETLLYFIMSF